MTFISTDSKALGQPRLTILISSASLLKALMCADTALCTTIPNKLHLQMHTASSDKQQRNTYNIKTPSAVTLLICTQLPSGMTGGTARTEAAHTASTGLYHNSWRILLTDKLVTGATHLSAENYSTHCNSLHAMLHPAEKKKKNNHTALQTYSQWDALF